MKWIIKMPEGWKPENKERNHGDPQMCTFCPFCDAQKEDGTYFCEPGECPLGEAIEFKEKI